MLDLRRFRKMEGETAAGVPCALHALADNTPTPPGAWTWEGGCTECGDAILYHTFDTTGRGRALAVEFYGLGAEAGAFTASRRGVAALAWLSRQAKPETAGPGETFKRALIEEHGRRMAEKWTALWRAASDDVLETAEALLCTAPDAELEAIIWPGEGC